MSRFAPAFFVASLLLAGTAAAYPVASGTSELRPLLGVTSAVDNQVTQVQVGLDYGYSWNGPWSFVLGGWAGFGKDFIGAEVHAGVKYRFLRVHPRMAPFVAGGGGFSVGFQSFAPPNADGSAPAAEKPKTDTHTLTGFGVRFGGGIDFFATERIVPGVQMMFDLGPSFTPSFGFQGSVQITFGCSFLL